MAEEERDTSDTSREQQRWRALHRLEDWLETPMVVLGFIWLVLLIIEFAQGAIAPPLDTATTIIWIIFILDFLLRLTLAPHKTAYLKHNWLTVIALLIPALRVLRIARAFAGLRALRAARGVRLLRLITSLNRGMKSLAQSLGRRGFGYVAALTVLVTCAGAAGMYAFEREALRDYGEALWWTAMVMTTLGSEYWPQSAEGRVLCLLLSLYAIAMFGYVAATLASYFIGQDAAAPDAEVAGDAALRALREEIAALRAELRARVEK